MTSGSHIIFVTAIALLGATLFLAACESRPGDKAYGRYPAGDSMTPRTSDSDWFKDIGN